MEIKTFHDSATWTLSHIAYDAETKDAVIIDPVLDLDTIGWRTHTDSLQLLDAFIAEHGLNVHYILDTHIHADHLSGMQYLKDKYQAKLVINKAITIVQETFKDVFNMASDADGHEFDVLVSDGDTLTAGSLNFKVLHLPGHTPACTGFHIENASAGRGTGRCDFPKGSASDLFNSVTTKLYSLPDDTRVFPGHDYPGDHRDLRMETTIGESKADNVDLPASRDKEGYIKFMEDRDKTLPLPRLIYQGVQVNMAAGQLPKAESNGAQYLKIPIYNDK